MITPLDIENKRFSKKVMNGYSTEEVDDFLDQITEDYEKIYKENTELRTKINELEDSITRYKSIEGTLNNTLLMAQKAADEVKNTAKQQADQIINNAQSVAKQSLGEIEQATVLKQKEYEDMKKQFDVYKAKMESLLISQLELLKDVNKE